MRVARVYEVVLSFVELPPQIGSLSACHQSGGFPATGPSAHRLSRMSTTSAPGVAPVESGDSFGPTSSSPTRAKCARSLFASLRGGLAPFSRSLCSAKLLTQCSECCSTGLLTTASERSAAERVHLSSLLKEKLSLGPASAPPCPALSSRLVARTSSISAQSASHGQEEPCRKLTSDLLRLDLLLESYGRLLDGKCLRASTQAFQSTG